MKGRLLGIALFVPLLSGCHVIERAQQCKKLARQVAKAAPEIQNTVITDDPSAQILRKKARLYGELGTRLEEIPTQVEVLQKDHVALINSLKNLENHLNDAADAVEKETAYRKEQEQADLAATSNSTDTPTRIPTLTRSTLHARRYGQAKRAAENAGRTMMSSAQRLTKSCF